MTVAMMAEKPCPTTPSSSHHIVSLESCDFPITNLPFLYTYQGYDSSTEADVAPRLKDATIAITAKIPITIGDLDLCPRLQCIFVVSLCVDWADHDAFAKYGVTVINMPYANVVAVQQACNLPMLVLPFASCQFA